MFLEMFDLHGESSCSSWKQHQDTEKEEQQGQLLIKDWIDWTSEYYVDIATLLRLKLRLNMAISNATTDK